MDELKEVDKLRRDLITNISHDIRTPISIIHGYIETFLLLMVHNPPDVRSNSLTFANNNEEH